MVELLALGLDGATFDLIEKWTKEGELPTFSKIMNNGTFGRLESTFPPMSPTAWTSSATGSNPGKHNIFNFFVNKGYEKKFVSANQRKSESIWHTINKNGKTVGVINFYTTYPPEKVNGFMISGQLTPGLDSDFTYPESLKEEILKKDYRIGLDFITLRVKDRNSFLREIKSIAEKRKDTTIHLMKKHNPDFLIVIFGCLDAVQHYFWGYMNPEDPNTDPEEASKYKDSILDFYKTMDKYVAEFLDLLDAESNLIIYSDHGFGPIYKNVCINSWLKEKDFLKMKDSFTRRNFYRKIGLTQENLQKIGLFGLETLKKLHLDNLIKSDTVRRKIPLSNPTPEEAIDWTLTRAWYTSWYQIRINTKGIEPQGIVEQGNEYEKLRDQIIEDLQSLRDPETNRKLIKKILKREDAYWGPYISGAPDLTFELLEGYAPEELIMDRVIVPPKEGIAKRSGDHTRHNGTVMLMGPRIMKNRKILDSKIFDIAPTILYLMDLPISLHMDGKVLIDAIDSKKLEKKSIKSK